MPPALRVVARSLAMLLPVTVRSLPALTLTVWPDSWLPMAWVWSKVSRVVVVLRDSAPLLPLYWWLSSTCTRLWPASSCTLPAACRLMAPAWLPRLAAVLCTLPPAFSVMSPALAMLLPTSWLWLSLRALLPCHCSWLLLPVLTVARVRSCPACSWVRPPVASFASWPR